MTGERYEANTDELAGGCVSPDESVVRFNCATGLKYDMPPVTVALDRHERIDYGA